MTPQSLFPDLLPTLEERVRRIDDEILWLLAGKSGGPLNLTLSADEKRVLSLVRYRRGASRSLTIREMREQMPPEEQISDRNIKKAVRSLRLQFHLPIGSSKLASEGGYFVIVTDEDRAIFRGGVLDQIKAELEVLRSVDGNQAALELLGQLSMQLGGSL